MPVAKTVRMIWKRNWQEQTTDTLHQRFDGVTLEKFCNDAIDGSKLIDLPAMD